MMEIKKEKKRNQKPTFTQIKDMKKKTGKNKEKQLTKEK